VLSLSLSRTVSELVSPINHVDFLPVYHPHIPALSQYAHAAAKYGFGPTELTGVYIKPGQGLFRRTAEGEAKLDGGGGDGGHDGSGQPHVDAKEDETANLEDNKGDSHGSGDGGNYGGSKP
jgi:hypothetical protein